MIVQDRQTLADIALMASGSVETIFRISRENDIPLDASSDILSGMEICTPEIINKNVVAYYEQNRIVPATEPNE